MRTAQAPIEIAAVFAVFRPTIGAAIAAVFLTGCNHERFTERPIDRKPDREQTYQQQQQDSAQECAGW